MTKTANVKKNGLAVSFDSCGVQSRRHKHSIKTFWENIISNFILRLIVSGILLSGIWGYCVYIYQINIIKNELFFQLEKANSHLLGTKTIQFSEIEPHVFEKFITTFDDQLTDFRIVMLDVYSVDQQSVFHYESASEAIKKFKKKKTISKPQQRIGQGKQTVIKYQDTIYFQILTPAYDENKFLGSINIMVALEPEIIGRFRKALIIALLHVAITISTMALVLYPLIHRSYHKLQHISRELRQSHLHTIVALGNAVAERDNNTDEHNYRVTYFSLCLAEHLKLPPQTIQSLVKGAFLHDVGKIGIHDNILLKPSSLTDMEYAIMKTHVDQGVKIVHGIRWLEDSLDVIMFHHERYDGSGYPLGIGGEQIPVCARIFAVVDVFDALISNRPYKDALSYANAIEKLISENRKFDPFVFSIFLEISGSLYSKAVSTGKKEFETYLKTRLSKYFQIY